MTTPVAVVKYIGAGGDYTGNGGPQAWADAAPKDFSVDVTSTTGAGSTTGSIQLNAGASAVAGAYVGNILTLIAAGESRLITAYNETTKVATVGSLNGSAATFTSAPSEGDSYNVGPVIWRGKIKNASDVFSNNNGTRVLALLASAGRTTTANAYYELTTDTGASWRDDVDVQTHELRYGTNTGCKLATTEISASVIWIEQPYTHISNLQISAFGGLGLSVGAQGDGGSIIENCIIEADSQVTGAARVSYGNTMRNCLVVQRCSTAASLILEADSGGPGTPQIINCTIVKPADLTDASHAIYSNNGGPAVKNCAIFGAALLTNGSATFDHCASDLAAGTGHFQTAYNTAFKNINDATRDFRLGDLSDLTNAGVTDATNAAYDIVGTSRPQGAAYDIGCWENVQAAAGVTRQMNHLRQMRG